MNKKHPVQKAEFDKNGILRFVQNDVVRYLLDNGGINMNMLAKIGFPDEDMEQFAQLIGYSVAGFGELSYASDDVVDSVWEMATTNRGEVDEQDA